jgi:CBS domain-containing protein
MQLYQVCSSQAVTARDDEPIADAAARMRFANADAAAVVDRRKILIGLITERDIVRAVADGADADKTPVHDYMTAGPMVLSPETAVSDAARIMLETGIRHLPIVAQDGTLVGLASMRDLLSELVSKASSF